MRYKIIQSRNVIEQDLGIIKVKQLLNQPDITGLSLALVHVRGTNRKALNQVSDSVYYVLKGKGTFTIGDEVVSVASGDAIFIPKGTSYFDSGEMTLLAFNSPRFDGNQVRYID